VFALPSAAALNHLLTQNSWALQRLARFAGKTARFDIAPFSLAWTILADGTLRNAEATASADAVCSIAPSLLPSLALHDEKAHAGIRSEGDAALLAEIFFLSRNLRWDAAEDLSDVAGDIAAERIVQAVQSTNQQLRDGALNLAQAAAEYWTEERPLLAKPQQVSEFMRQVDTLRDDVARLEQRIKHHVECADMSAPNKSGDASPHSKN
jgi:ubiquinone biosynthesis protein UbiJ